jgi:hypothetical protein
VRVASSYIELSELERDSVKNCFQCGGDIGTRANKLPNIETKKVRQSAKRTRRAAIRLTLELIFSAARRRFGFLIRAIFPTQSTQCACSPVLTRIN